MSKQPAAPASAAPASVPTPVAVQTPRALLTLEQAHAAVVAHAEARGYPVPLRTVAQTATGAAARVVVACQHPQTRLGVSVCAKEREIATQDLFQVRCCVPCADRLVRLARRAKAKARMARAKDALRAQEAGLR